MGPIRNPRWEQKRTEGCVIISSKYAEQNEQLFTDVLCHVHYNVLDNLKKNVLYETSSRTTRYISVLKENVDIFLKHLKFELNFHTDIDVSVKIFCCLTCYKSFNSFCRSDTGEEVMFQPFQYINTCLHVYIGILLMILFHRIM
jgi:hypothetical protein